MNHKNNIQKYRQARLSNRFVTPFRLSLVLSVLAFSSLLRLHAKQVSARQALDIARKYVTLDRRLTAVPRTRGNGRPATEPFYVFNDARGKGYVVVSGDDAMGEILAYSDAGKLDTLNANPGARLLLQAYRERFAQLQQQPEAAQPVTVQPSTRALPGYKAVAPLLTCKWDQVFPYNKNTGYPYTGCVATAMAQVMFYHKWPVQGRGENSYTVVYDNQVKHADFSQSYYDWGHMKNIYNYYHPSTDVEKDAVALLMSDIGIATGMQYTNRASGAYNEQAESAWQKHFDYTTAFVRRADEGTAGFTEIVRQELLDGFPVYLSGYYAIEADGHAWVTDGMDSNGLFHMNFGWGGQSDGYFSLTATDVAQSGGEFGGRPLSFKVGLIAILTHPNKPGKKIDPSLLADSPKLRFTLEGSLTLPDGHAKTFAVGEMPAVEMAYFINKGSNFKGDIGVGIFDMNGKMLIPCASDDHAVGGFTDRVFGKYDDGYMKKDNVIVTPQKIKVSLTDPARLGDGYYQLLPICVPKREDGSWGEWGRMKLAPRMVIEISNGSVRVVEEDFLTAGFQFAEQPSVRHVKPGSEEKIYFSIRNKSGLERTCQAKLQLLNADGTVALEVRREQKTAFSGFDTTLLPFAVDIPASFAEGQYRIAIELIKENPIGIDNPAAERYAVEKLYGKDDTFLDISLLPTGIDNTTAPDFHLTHDGNTLTLQGCRLQWVKLFDTNGRLLKHFPAAAQNQASLSIADLAPGIYLVQTAADGHIRAHRFVKQ